MRFILDLEYALHPITGALIREGGWDSRPRDTEGRKPQEDGGRDWSLKTQSLQQQKRESQNRFSLVVSRRNQPDVILSLDF